MVFRKAKVIIRKSWVMVCKRKVWIISWKVVVRKLMFVVYSAKTMFCNSRVCISKRLCFAANHLLFLP